MRPIVLFPKGTLEEKDKDRMSAAGYVAFEVEDPSKVVILDPSTSLVTSDDLLMAAMAGVNCPVAGHHKQRMVEVLCERMQARDRKANPPRDEKAES